MRAYHYENNLKLQGIVDRFFFRVHRPRPSAHLARVLVDFRKEKQNNVCVQDSLTPRV